MSNNNGSRYLIKSREQKRKLSLFYRERMFSVCFLHFRNALGSLESTAHPHSQQEGAGGGRGRSSLLRS